MREVDELSANLRMEAYKEGSAAQAEGAPSAANPYEAGLSTHTAWNRGYAAAHRIAAVLTEMKERTKP